MVEMELARTDKDRAGERVPNEIVGGGAIRFIEARTMLYQPTRGLQNRAPVVVRVNCNKGRGVCVGEGGVAGCWMLADWRKGAVPAQRSFAVVRLARHNATIAAARVLMGNQCNVITPGPLELRN